MDSVLNPSSGGHSTRCGRPDPTNQPSINARSWVGGGRDAVEALGGGYRGSSMVSVDRHRRRRRNAKLDRSPRSSYIGRAATYAHTRDTRSAGRCRGVAKLIFLLGTTGGQRPRFNSSGELTKDPSRIHAGGVGVVGGAGGGVAQLYYGADSQFAASVSPQQGACRSFISAVKIILSAGQVIPDQRIE